MLVAHENLSFRANCPVPFRTFYQDALALLDLGPVTGLFSLFDELLERTVAAAGPQQTSREKDSEFLHPTPRVPRGDSLAPTRTDNSRGLLD